ncbi:hypothetical protein [Streptomyces flavofungini]|uniref:hypothetical protein n=1 Tax=Streptomyces flavofungini TaxID=68200 RepID=UPI0025AFEDDC|nr:hypothetical protein [Streptomyces flavofungini]WJV49906.1 hypothetical protein QUY26_32915 [Streptomyces flavofungini]
MTTELAMPMATLTPAVALALALEVRKWRKVLDKSPQDVRAWFLKRPWKYIGTLVYVYSFTLIFVEWDLLSWLGTENPRPDMSAKGGVIWVMVGLTVAVVGPALSFWYTVDPWPKRGDEKVEER